MTVESEAVYFVSRSDGVEGKDMRVYFAPLDPGLVVPKEVVRVRSMLSQGRRFWEMVTDKLRTEAPEDTTLTPSNLSEVGASIEQFMHENPIGGITLDCDAPDEIKTTIHDIQESISKTNGLLLSHHLGIRVQQEDTRPMPGMYL